MDRETLDRFAELVVGVGANVQRGQIVAIGAEPGKEELTRAIAGAAYKRGAKYVEVSYFDFHVKRARLLHAAEDTLDFVPSWIGERILALGDQRCARIGLSGPVEPALLEDVDPVRAGRDALPRVKESAKVVNDLTTNWTIVPCPTPGWAQLVHPELDPEAALARLWEQIVHVCRLEEPDPGAAWRERAATLTAIATRLTDAGLDALHFEGDGTDLRVGLLPSSRWIAAQMKTVDGIEHIPNLPTEEVFTTPDPERTEGVVRATRPLFLDGSRIEGLRVRFEGGRAVEIDADRGAEILRGNAARDEGSARLGEVALVDRTGRIGPLGTVFYDTLLDENAASHVALGGAYHLAVGKQERERANHSQIHIDFMIGGDDVAVTGITADGAQIPVLRDGAWQL